MAAWPVRTEAVLLQKAVNLSPSVGAPAPGANGCVPVRTEAVLLQKGGQPPSLGRSTRPGREGCLPVRTEAVLLQKAGQPLPGCDGCGADARRQNFLQQGLHVDARTSSGELIY